MYARQYALHLALLPLMLLMLIGCNEESAPDQQPLVQRRAVVEPDVGIETIAKMMSDSGYSETMLQISTGDPNKRLKMWDVGDGVLIATYDSKSNNSDSVTYRISSGGPKLHQKNWSFPVETFDPTDGTMTISIGHP